MNATRAEATPGSLKPGTVYQLVTHSPAETIEFGRKLAGEIRPPCLIILEGQLGSGKTTLAKGIISGLGVAREEEVTSPSFTLVHEYGGDVKAYHVDLFRIEDSRELATLGLEDLWSQPTVVLVEWGERLGDNAPTPGVRIQLEYLEIEDRRITVECLGT